ncbi:hypothetical protein DW886_00130 [Enterocloster aldenensis]|nr:hypothetical protein DW886_00130 [Enterocloster aldenensis]
MQRAAQNECCAGEGCAEGLPCRRGPRRMSAVQRKAAQNECCAEEGRTERIPYRNNTKQK